MAFLALPSLRSRPSAVGGVGAGAVPRGPSPDPGLAVAEEAEAEGPAGGAGASGRLSGAGMRQSGDAGNLAACGRVGGRAQLTGVRRREIGVGWGSTHRLRAFGR